MNVRKLLAFVVIAAASLGAAAADPVRSERGFPLLTIYRQSQHKGGSQTFDAGQDTRGVMYFGNLHGVLVYDGAWWRMLALPNASAAFRVTCNDRGDVAVGGVGELGLVATSENDELSYRSLVRELPPNARDFGDVHAIAPAGEHGFVFVTDRFVIFWTGNEARVIADARQRGAYTIGGTVYLAGANGLEKIDPTMTHIVPVALPGRDVDLVVDGGDGRVIVVTRNDGLYALASAGIVPFAPATAAWLRGKTITGGCRLRDGRIVISTRQDGLLVVDANGDPDQLIDTAAGLPDDIVAGAFTDREGSLWLPMHGAIARLDIASPVTLLDTRSGIKGAINIVARIGGRLYAGTSHGLYVIDQKVRGVSAANIAKPIAGVPGAVWRIDRDRNGTLLAATSNGLYELRGTAAPAVVHGTEGIACYDFLLASDRTRGWLLTRQFVATIVRDASGAWHFGARIPGTPPHARTIVERNGVLWCGTIFNGIVRIDTNVAPPRMTTFGSGEMQVIDAAGEIVFVRKRAILRLAKNGTLEPHPVFAGVTPPPGEVFYSAAIDARGALWLNSHPPRRIERDDDGRYRGDGQPVVAIDAMSIPTIVAEPDGVVWIGTDSGLYRYESAPSVPLPQPRPSIRVASNAKELAHGFSRLRIEFAPASYRPGVTYEYKLEPNDAAWSAWTTEPFIDFTNLGDGDYTFHLRARGAGSPPSDEAKWSFRVVPPWYRAPWAIALWVLVAAAIVYLVVRVRTHALHRQAENLRSNIAERTNELRQTVDQLRSAQQQLVEKNELLIEANGRLERLSLLDELTGIANRRYFQRALADDWGRAREQRLPLALVLIDLDHFKDLNDRHGHQAGDACLRLIGAFLAQQSRRSGDIAIRAGDLVARYGGEEFALLLVDTTGDEARLLAERLRAGIEALAIPYDDDTTLRVTASCGVASVVPSDDDGGATLIARADHALYAAKYQGRNRVAIAAEESPIRAAV